MRVLVLSDTHIPVTQKDLPLIIQQEAKKSDCCLHAGDFLCYEVFQKLSQWTTVYGVSGNMDNSEVQNKLPEKQVVQIEKIRIGLIHGSGAPASLVNYVKKEFFDQLETIDIFIFGHSHFAFDKEIENKTYFNPGSPTDSVFAPYRSYGILNIDGSKITRSIVKIE